MPRYITLADLDISQSDFSNARRRDSTQTDYTARNNNDGHPPALRDYLRNDDRYQAFLAGRRDSKHENGQKVSQMMQKWNVAWERHGLSGGGGSGKATWTTNAKTHQT